MEKLNDQIAQEISAIRQVIEAHAGDNSTVDLDALTERVRGIVRTETDAALAAAQAKRPVYRGEIIGEDGFSGRSQGRIEGGRFDGQKADDVIFARNFMERAHGLDPANVRPPSRELQEAATRALSATGTATGKELVPTGMAAEMWMDFFLASKVVANMQKIPQPTDPFDLPLLWGAVTWRKGSANTATTPQDPPTAKSTMAATEQVVEVDWAYNLDEDAILAVLPSLRTELARSGGEQMDSFVLNADSVTTANTNINLIDGTPPSDSYYLRESGGQDGIRKLFLVDNTGQKLDVSGNLSDANMRTVLGYLGKYIADPSAGLIVADAKTYITQLMGLTNVATREKFGDQATVLTGQLAAYAGVPIVVSESLFRTDATGKISATASNNTKGQLALFNRNMWRVGFRRELLVEVDRDIKKRQFVMVVSFRESVVARGTRSTATHTAGAYDIT